MNLIPQAIADTGNYWCTWRTQSTALESEAMRRDSRNLRNRIDEDFLFGQIGTLNRYFEGVRGDLIVVLDDGWDVPYDPPTRKGRGMFGSLELNQERFPFTYGTPVQRLRQMSDRVRALGYRGLGLWIACQQPFDDDHPGEVALEAERQYWSERARWCAEAGIVYWKVDWGRSCQSVAYRQMMTDVVRQYAQGLRIEHAFTQAAWDQPYAERLEDDERGARFRGLLRCSDFLRAYDVVPEFRYTTMFSRTAEILHHSPGGKGRINIEDPVQIGAALGCSLGIMRHQIEEQRAVKQTLVTPIRDAERALRWQRIAPPFGVEETSFSISRQMVTDRWSYPVSEAEQWPYLGGKTIEQQSPAAISRGMALPQVHTDGPLPLVGCSLHPNGALAVGCFPRTIDGRLNHAYPAHVTLQGASACALAGVFGFFRSLTIVMDQPPAGRLYAQDLAGDEAVDITSEVKTEGSMMTIPGAIIERVGLMNARNREYETPGLVLQWKNI